MDRERSSQRKGLDGVVHRRAYHRWVILGASTLVMIAFYGTELSFGVLLKPIIEEFGWTRAAVAGAISTVVGIAGPMGILTGRIADRFGSRSVVTIGALFGVLGYLMMARANSLWDLYIFFGFFLGICISTCWGPLIGSVSRYFPDRRVFAIGILTSGLTMGSMVMPPVIAHLVVAYGWRHCFLILAAILFVSSLPAILLLGKEAPLDQEGFDGQRGGWKSKTGQTPPLSDWSAVDAVKTFSFLVIVTLGFVTAMGFYLMAAHMVAYATDMGIPATSAALILSSQSIGNIIGKLSIWFVIDRIGTRLTLVFVLSLQALCVALLVWPNTLWPLCTLSAIYGYGLGSSMALRMSIIPEYFGTAAVATLVGIAGIAWGLGGIAGPVLAGKIFDVTRSYNAAFISAGVTLSLGIIAASFLKPPVHRD